MTSAPSGVTIAWEVTVAKDGFLTGFQANVAFAGFGELKVALYEDDAGQPGELVAASESTAEVAGTFDLDIDYSGTDSCEPVVEADTYWLVAKGVRTGSSSSMGYVTNDTGLSLTSYYTVESYSADFPDPYNGTAWTASYRLHIGIVVEEQ